MRAPGYQHASSTGAGCGRTMDDVAVHPVSAKRVDTQTTDLTRPGCRTRVKPRGIEFVSKARTRSRAVWTCLRASRGWRCRPSTCVARSARPQTTCAPHRPFGGAPEDVGFRVVRYSERLGELRVVQSSVHCGSEREVRAMRPATPTTRLEELPHELLLHAFAFLDAPSLHALAAARLVRASIVRSTDCRRRSARSSARSSLQTPVSSST